MTIRTFALHGALAAALLGCSTPRNEDAGGAEKPSGTGGTAAGAGGTGAAVDAASAPDRAIEPPVAPDTGARADSTSSSATEVGGAPPDAGKPPLGTIVEFPIGRANASPGRIGMGPGGDLWFSEVNANLIGRITMAGAISEFPVPTADAAVLGVAFGRDVGHLWFAEGRGNKIARMTSTGMVTEFPLSTKNAWPTSLVVDPQGRVWFDESAGQALGRLTPETGAIDEFTTQPPLQGSRSVALGLGGVEVWFVDSFAGKIGRASAAGEITMFPLPNALCYPNGLTLGPDGAMWFAENMTGQIGRITTAGVVTEFPVLPSSGHPIDITTGIDGNLWFTELSGNRIGRITPAGVVTTFPIPTTDSMPVGITTGPDGNIWFTESASNKIGRLSL